MYYLETKTIIGDVSVVFDNDARLWHLKIAHTGEGGMNELKKQGIIFVENKFQLFQHEDCILGKHKRLPYNTSKAVSHNVLDYIHADL